MGTSGGLRVKVFSRVFIAGCLVAVALGCVGCGNSRTMSIPCSPETCHVIVPPCGASVTLGSGMPRDASAQVGFVPYVATWLPADVYWYSSQPYAAGNSSAQLLPAQPRPLMRVEYAFDFPRPYNSYALHTVIALDETTQPLNLKTNILLPSQTAVGMWQKTVDVGGHAATYFELRSGNGETTTKVIGVEWQVGAVWLRVTAVTQGSYALALVGSGTSAALAEAVVAWSGTSTDELLHVARSVKAYTGCDGTSVAS